MLRHLESYHSPFGIDKVMRQKSEEIRMGITSKQPSCTFIQNGKKCAEAAIVCTKYCIKHILFHIFFCFYIFDIYLKNYASFEIKFFNLSKFEKPYVNHLFFSFHFFKYSFILVFLSSNCLILKRNFGAKKGNIPSKGKYILQSGIK